jgi:hypothetical protein
VEFHSSNETVDFSLLITRNSSIMLRYLTCLLIGAVISGNVYAQDEHDALRYGFNTVQGTARGMSIGGAVGSIGADFSALSVNPAGIGIYKSGELLFSPSFTGSSNKATYLGTSAKAGDAKFNLSNFGIVVANTQPGKRRNSGWKAVNFAFGMNRMNTFRNEYTYRGRNQANSLIETFADDFNSMGGINNNTLNSVNFSAYAAYQTYLVDRGIGADSSRAVSYVPYWDGLNQTKRVIESGGMSEYVISVGGNYMEKLMLGATLGIISTRYDRTLRFNEEDASGNPNNDFRYMQYTERLSTSGTGINLKIGAIYKPSQAFRFGLALHTPSHIELNDVSSISMVSHTDSLLLSNNPGANPVSLYDQDSSQVFNYALTTPYKANISGAVFFGRSGFITADLEYVNYATMRYRFAGFENAADAINEVIRNTYRDAVNIRVGAEARLEDVSIRAGMAHYGSPSANESTYGGLTNISAGLGFRQTYWFIDAAYVQSIQKNNEVPYIIARSDANVQAASINRNRGTFVLSMGVKF